MAIAITAGILIVNNDNKVLIAHPTNHAPDFWSIPKGKTEEGETLWQTALRETYEETNIQLDEKGTSYYRLPRVTYRHKKKAVYVFIVKEIENKFNSKNFELRCNSNVEPERGGFPEMDDFKWVSIEEAEKLVHYTQLDALQFIKNS